MKAELKYKLGDKIIVVASEDGQFCQNGWIGEIVDLDNSIDNKSEEYYVRFDNHRMWWVYEGEIELYTEDKQDLNNNVNFKVGDNVETTKDNDDGLFSKGCTGTVVYVDEKFNIYRVKFITGEFVSGGDNCWWCNADEIKVADKSVKDLIDEFVIDDVDGFEHNMETEPAEDKPIVDLDKEPLTDFGYTPKQRPSEVIVAKDDVDYLALCNKLSTKQFLKLEKIALKLDKIGESIGADYHQMLELLKRHF